MTPLLVVILVALILAALELGAVLRKGWDERWLTAPAEAWKKRRAGHTPENCLLPLSAYPPPQSTTYELVEDGAAIRCLCCGLTSWHQEDVRSLYCSFCHRFHKG